MYTCSVHSQHYCSIHCFVVSKSEQSEKVNSPMKQVLPHPFMKLLHDLWPFGEDFKDLGIGGKYMKL